MCNNSVKITQWCSFVKKTITISFRLQAKWRRETKNKRFGRFCQFLTLFERFLASSNSETVMPPTNNTNPTISSKLSLCWEFIITSYDLYATFARNFLSFLYSLVWVFYVLKTMANGTTSFRFATICRHFGIVNELLLLLCVFCWY